MKKSFKDRILLGLRKIVISLKRNYYIIPLLLVAVCAVQFMCNLYIMSPAFTRIDATKMAALLTFVITLFTVLATVAYLNYALVKYGQKRPIVMLIIYYALAISSLVLTFIVFNANYEQLLAEYTAKNDAVAEAEIIKYNEYIRLETLSYSILMGQIILQFVTLTLVSTAPIVQKLLRKITFKRIASNEEPKNEE